MVKTERYAQCNDDMPFESNNNSFISHVAKAGPIAIQVQAGEFELISTLMRYSLPHLTGWAQQFDIAMKNALNEGISGGGGGGGSSGGAGGDLPF